MLLIDGLRLGGSYLARSRSRSRHLRQSKIKNLGVPALRDEDVGGLYVPVNDALCMSGVERVCNLDGEREDYVDVYRAIANAVPQRHAVQILHRDERFAIVLADLVYRADVWMV